MEESEEETLASVRVDLWTYSVRLFKTRSQAASACRKAHLLVNDQKCRPSRQVRVGDILTVRRGQLTRTLEIKALLEKRIGAKLVDDFLTDRTPPEEYERAAEIAKAAREAAPKRDTGSGRPTKRERRDLDELMEDSAAEQANFDRFVKSIRKR